MSNVHPNMTGADNHIPGYHQSSDPGAVGAGIFWEDTTTNPSVFKVRNQANSGWYTLSQTTGTVTSVAQSVPAELSIAGSPITSTGTLALTWASGTGSGGQGKVIATPSGGGSGAYAGRVLDATDLPATTFREVSTNTTAATTDQTIVCDTVTAANGIQVTMPALSNVPAGKRYELVNTDPSATYRIEVIPDGSDLVNGNNATLIGTPSCSICVTKYSVGWIASEYIANHT